MIPRVIACRQTLYFPLLRGILIPGILLAGAGCHTYMPIQLEPCTFRETAEIPSAIRYETPELLRFQYSLQINKKKFTCNGVSRKTKDDQIFIAGYSTSGITMFSANWKNHRWIVVKNNLSMPDSYLQNTILKDLLLIYLGFPEGAVCVCNEKGKDDLWLEIQNPYYADAWYLKASEGGFSWNQIHDGRLFYEASTQYSEGVQLDTIEITSYQNGYQSEIRYINEPL